MRLAGVLLLLAVIVIVAVVLRRRRSRADLVLVTAVLLGAMIVAVVGVTVWGLLAGVVVGVGVPIAVHWLLPTPPPDPIDRAIVGSDGADQPGLAELP